MQTQQHRGTGEADAPLPAIPLKEPNKPVIDITSSDSSKTEEGVGKAIPLTMCMALQAFQLSAKLGIALHSRSLLRVANLATYSQAAIHIEASENACPFTPVSL